MVIYEPKPRRSVCALTEFVQDLIRNQARTSPDEWALVDEVGRQINYRTLMEQVAQFAARLKEVGVSPEDRVAVRTKSSIATIVSMLAIFDAGGAYVPIDINHPAVRAKAIMENVRAHVAITDMDLKTAIPAGTLIVDPSYRTRVAAKAANINVAHKPDSLAYIVHTSGSTGMPKGVAMSHAALMRLVQWQIADGPRALRTLQFTSTSFDVTFQEILSTLGSGGTLVLASQEVRRNPELLLRTLIDRSVQRLFLPYFALQQMAKAAQRIGQVPRSLQHLIVAGESLIITEPISLFLKSIPKCRLDNQYGPTETHLVTSHTLPPSPAVWPALPAIGKPAMGVKAYNLDANLVPVPKNVNGELYVGGTGVARGYLGDPARTAERFVADPFSDELGSRMYRTGDIVRTEEDDLLHFVSRTDEQIKVRGFNVNPSEIESSLLGHPRIREAAVRLREIGPDVMGLVGFIVTDGLPLTVTELSGYLRAQLPGYMVPSRFMFLKALPLASSGKIDNRALRQVELPGAEELPESASISAIVNAIWERVLGHSEFEPDDDFFEVGGDSQLAVWVATEMSHAFDRTVDLSVFLEDSTPTGLAEAVSGASLRRATRGLDSHVRTLRAGSPQRVLYFLHSLSNELLPYRELAQAMRSPLRIAGIQMAGEPNSDDISLEEIALVHRAQLRLIQPEGPYLICGWSFGGLVAYELAQQLMAEGEQVEFLGLVEANPVRDPLTGLRTNMTGYLDVLGQASDMVDNGASLRDLFDLASKMQWGNIILDIAPPGAAIEYCQRAIRISRRNMRAAREYRPVAYSGPVHLFQAADSAVEIREQLAAELRELVSGAFHIHEVPGDHRGILRIPQVTTTALEIDMALRSNGKA
jgi:amino acid adenylation domain-containing protein